MTLARRMMLATTALVLSLLAIGFAAIWGVSSLGRDLDVALTEYEKLRSVYAIGPNLVRARAMLEGGEPTDPRVFRDLQDASIKLAMLTEDDPSASARLTALRDLLRRLEIDDYDIRPPSVDEQVGVINSVIGYLAKLATQTSATIAQTQATADAKRATTIVVVSVLTLLITLAAFAIAIWQYGIVMRPLQRLRQGVKTITHGRFTDRLSTDEVREFADLAHEFNQMAGELDELYRDLEAKVAAKSKELVRSERLASVGFLAAGVAHEINNPLGIMSGYAELSLRKLNKHSEDAQEHAVRSLEIICEESQRCKKIIQKLLSLVRGGPVNGETEQRERISIAQIVRDVTEIVQGLPRYRGRKIETKIPAPGAPETHLCVMGRENELKQVLLNLVINALEAVDAKRGLVVISAMNEDQHVVLEVADNGKGMSSHTMDHIFEPFFTEKRGVGNESENAGTGLGLSITHAIVQQHGGRIHGSSDGLGKGSRFIVALPVAG